MDLEQNPVNRQMVRTAIASGYERGTTDERARVVRLLRDLAHEFDLGGAVALSGAADMIERNRA